MRPYSSPSARRARRLLRHLEASGHLNAPRSGVMRLFHPQVALAAPQPPKGDARPDARR